MYRKNTKIIIAGAGPGDPDLISIKAFNAIKDADVILYDSLINLKLLDYAKKNSLKIFVGKRAGNHILSQSEINNLCVKYANDFGFVLRLKGGDPFIFGRGYEEMEHAVKMGICVEVIPGISSSTSLATLSGIPLTCRGINHGFCVITAVDRYGKLTEELVHAAKSGLTTVILMGFNKLREISLLYDSFGKGDTPSIIISNGSLPNEKKLYATIKDLYNEISNKNIEIPATIIVGEVVKLIKHTKSGINNNEYSVSHFSETI